MTAVHAEDRVVRRYRHLLRTADPDELEFAHEDAFDQLSASDRRLVRERLGDELPLEREAELGESSLVLARELTRLELRRPGTAERVLRGWMD
jgi:hypothetical protein